MPLGAPEDTASGRVFRGLVDDPVLVLELAEGVVVFASRQSAKRNPEMKFFSSKHFLLDSSNKDR